MCAHNIAYCMHPCTFIVFYDLLVLRAPEDPKARVPLVQAGHGRAVAEGRALRPRKPPRPSKIVGWPNEACRVSRFLIFIRPSVSERSKRSVLTGLEHQRAWLPLRWELALERSYAAVSTVSCSRL